MVEGGEVEVLMQNEVGENDGVMRVARNDKDCGVAQSFDEA